MPYYTMRDILKAAVVLICVSSFPMLYIFAYNAGLAEPSDLLVPLVLVIAISHTVGLLITLLVRNLYAGMVITAAVVMLFFSYGHIYLLLANASEPVLIFLGRDIVLIPIWLAILILVIRLTIKLKHNLQRAMPAILTFSIVLIAPPLFQTGLFITQNNQYPNDTSGLPPTDVGSYRARVDPLPDVYYIILDGYARADILQQNFNYDNGEFIRALEQRGFYVAEQSFSNYPLTKISVSSSLNMDYHDASRFEENEKIVENQYEDMIIHNKVTDALNSLGYDYSTISPPTPTDSQVEFQAGAPLLFETEFFYIVTKSSLLGALDRVLPAPMPVGAMQDTRGDKSSKPLNTVERRMALLPEFADDQVPSFVYGHYYSPHPPYDYTKSIYEDKTSSMDGSAWEDREAYVREIQGLNQTVLNTIDEILARSDTPPIIIIQGDHGPATKLKEDRLSWLQRAGKLAKKMPEDVRFERFAILNAYYGPPEMLAALYPSISPVNSFRVVLSYLTNHEDPFLPDRSFVATYVLPIKYIEVPELHNNVRP